MFPPSQFLSFKRRTSMIRCRLVYSYLNALSLAMASMESSEVCSSPPLVRLSSSNRNCLYCWMTASKLFLFICSLWSSFSSIGRSFFSRIFFNFSPGKYIVNYRKNQTIPQLSKLPDGPVLQQSILCHDMLIFLCCRKSKLVTIIKDHVVVHC